MNSLFSCIHCGTKGPPVTIAATGDFFWSRVRESNPPHMLGKHGYYRCTNPAYQRSPRGLACLACKAYYNRNTGKNQALFAVFSFFVFRFFGFLSKRSEKTWKKLKTVRFRLRQEQTPVRLGKDGPARNQTLSR